MNNHGRSLLIVSGDRSIRTLLADHLGFTFDVSTARSGVEALNMLSAQPYSLLLADMAVSGMSGLELCGLAAERYPDVPVVVLCSMAEIDCAVRALRSGAFDYVAKPVKLKEVSIAVERAMLGLSSFTEPARLSQSIDADIQAVLNRPAPIRAAHAG